MIRRPRIRLLHSLTLLGLVLVVTTGCTQTPAHLKNCRLVGGKGTWNGDYYVATILLENANTTDIDLKEVQFELVGYDAQQRVVDSRSHTMLGTVRPLQRDRIRLDLFDDNHAVRSSHAILKDTRGRLISECTIHGTWVLGAPPAAPGTFDNDATNTGALNPRAAPST